MTYPDDANGDALRRLQEHGDDLSRARKIDFNVVFAEQSGAEQFAEHFRALGREVTVEKTEAHTDLPWDVVVVQNMVPSYDAIVAFERLLESVATRWGGQNDGWGCFTEQSPTD